MDSGLWEILLLATIRRQKIMVSRYCMWRDDEGSVSAIGDCLGVLVPVFALLEFLGI